MRNAYGDSFMLRIINLQSKHWLYVIIMGPISLTSNYGLDRSRSHHHLCYANHCTSPKHMAITSLVNLHYFLAIWLGYVKQSSSPPTGFVQYMIMLYDVYAKQAILQLHANDHAHLCS